MSSTVFWLETEDIFFLYGNIKEWLNELIERLITLYPQVISPKSELNQQ